MIVSSSSCNCSNHIFTRIYLEYGVTANITAFHHRERGSSGFDSPYSNDVFMFGFTFFNNFVKVLVKILAIKSF